MRWTGSGRKEMSIFLSHKIKKRRKNWQAERGYKGTKMLFYLDYLLLLQSISWQN